MIDFFTLLGTAKVCFHFIIFPFTMIELFSLPIRVLLRWGRVVVCWINPQSAGLKEDRTVWVLEPGRLAPEWSILHPL
jgi:hypothetical protein